MDNNYSLEARSKPNTWTKNIKNKIGTLAKRIKKILIWGIYAICLIAIIIGFLSKDLFSDFTRMRKLPIDIRKAMLEDAETMKEKLEIDLMIERDTKIKRYYEQEEQEEQIKEEKEKQGNNQEIEKISANKVIREVTAYNSVENQTDKTPCIGAFGDICKLYKDKGLNICATNRFPAGTVLEIENYGRCVVWDRMNKRYQERIDIYMDKDVQRARKFGTQNLAVAAIGKINPNSAKDLTLSN